MSAPALATVRPQKEFYFKIAEIREVEKAGKVAHQIHGIATIEEVDGDNEICDYADTKPLYQKWCQSFYDKTTAAGQDASYGNVRLQHGIEMGGKIESINFDDENKCIRVVVEPLDDDIWKKVKKGFYTGFSQGGSFTYRNCNKCGTDCGPKGNFYCPNCLREVVVRYACDPTEISLVDAPCATSAVITMVKVDGSKEQVVIKAKTKRVADEDLSSSAFAYVGDPDTTSTWHYPIKFSSKEKTIRHVRNALSQWNKPNGQKNIPEGSRAAVYAKIVAAARRNGVHVSRPTKTLEVVAGKVEKSLYHIGWAADIMSSLRNLRDSNRFEADYEGDERDAQIAEELQELLEAMVGVGREIFDEETDELINAAQKAAVTKGANMNEESLNVLKAARKSLKHHFTKAAAHHEAMAEHHKAQHEEHMAACETCKAVMEDDDAKALHPHFKALGNHHKAFAAHHLKMHKAHAAHAAHNTAMAAAQEEPEGAKAAATEPTTQVVKTQTTETAPAAAPGPVAVPAAPAAPAGTVNKAAAATEAPGEPVTEMQAALDSMVKTSFAESIARVASSDDVKKSLDTAVADMLMSRLGHRVQPSALKTAGLDLIPRGIEQPNVTKAANGGIDMAGVPMELADMLTLELE